MSAMTRNHFANSLAVILIVVAARAIGANPTLTVGVWTPINPSQLTWSGVQGSGTSFSQGMAIDPSNPSILYLTTSNFNYAVDGLYKSTDAGSTWTRIGKVTNPMFQGADTIIEEGMRIRIDPNNSQHLYCGDGVRGSTEGFWVSTNGGTTWTRPAGWVGAAASIGITQSSGMDDVYDVAVEPGDFNHVLVSFHSPWSWGSGQGVYSGNAGILESKDGGQTWIAHDPIAGWGQGHSVWFLKGSTTTWLIGTQGDGFWRTTNSGTTWTQVTTENLAHGGGELYYAKTGTLYAGCGSGIMRSTDNGVTWSKVGTGKLTFCTGIFGDGTTLYAHNGYGGASEPWYTSPETDGATWTAQSGAGSFSCGPFEMALDSINRIVYSSTWASGLLALKLPPCDCINATIPGNRASAKASLNSVRSAGKSGALYNVKGELIGRARGVSSGHIQIGNIHGSRQVLIAD